MCSRKKKDRDARKRKKHDPQNMSIRELYVQHMLFAKTCYLMEQTGILLNASFQC